MKNIFPVLIPALIVLPLTSFGQLKTTTAQQDVQSRACFATMAQERAQWMSQHQQIIKDLDAHGKAILNRQTNVPSIPAAENQVYAAFMSQQAGEKAACLAKLAQ